MSRASCLSCVCVLILAACAGQAEEEIVLSGRVQLDPESAEPVANAFVRVTDSNKSKRCFVTACDGTFEVRRSDLRQLVLPLTNVTVERVDAPQEAAGLTRTLVTSRMRGGIRETRSCNGCHAGGVSLFPNAGSVPPDVRTMSSTCASSEIRCPEDRVVDDQLDLIRDFPTYEERVHAVFVRRCAECHDRGDAAATFGWMRNRDGATLMENARGHGGVEDGDFADQCLADWLGVTRAPSPVKVTHADACRRAAE